MNNATGERTPTFNIGYMVSGDDRIVGLNIVKNIDVLMEAVRAEANPCTVITLCTKLFDGLEQQELDIIKEDLFSTLQCMVDDKDSMFAENHLADINSRLVTISG